MIQILTKSQFGRESQIKRIFILGEGGDGCAGIIDPIQFHMIYIIRVHWDSLTYRRLK